VRLAELIATLAPVEVRGDPAVEVTGVAYDHRRLQPGNLFLAWKGTRFDGHDFIRAAFAAGAAAVVAERADALPDPLPPGRAAVLVRESRRAAGPVSAAFFGHPTARLGLVGVTGTNGKTTTTFLLREVLQPLGPVGLIGTVSAIVGGERRPVRLTTPEAPDLQATFADMVRSGDRWCVMEVSSMALAQYRVEAAAFDFAVFTNLTPDHLGPQEHPSFAHYVQSKRHLFELVGRPVPGAPPKSGWRGAVINADDPRGALMAEAAAPAVPVLRYGLGAGADVRAEDIRLAAGITEFTVCHHGGRERCALRLSGGFNVYNALAAFGVGLLCRLPAPEIAAALGRLEGVPGRMTPVPGNQPFSVFVDYAHTPDGLENVLRAARELAKGRVLVVFGCGGDRDRTKRPLMGEIAARLADACWLTSDNPRSEPPEAILREIEAGAARVPGARYRLVVDRREAIAEAIAAAAPGDVVIIAGKGHEDYQIFADRTIHFDDREEAAAALARLGYR
jgi:UDP-N-acetylmuramoyl-L-alanyl-D-glutamate--2,6-diaminopimelate ligase